MNVKTAIESRRSVKAFDPAHRMSEVEVRELLGQAMLAPTAFNIQNWRFVVVDDPALRQEIRKVAWDQSQVTDASLLLVLCADLKAWEKKPERYWRNVDAPIRDFMVPAIHQYYVGKEQVQRDEAMRSCGLAGMALMLTAQEMGYDTCPMDGFDFDAVGKLIQLPDDHVISFMLAVGRGIRPPFPRGGQLAPDEVVVHDRFRQLA